MICTRVLRSTLSTAAGAVYTTTARPSLPVAVSLDDKWPKSVMMPPTAISMRNGRFRTGCPLGSKARMTTWDVLAPSCGSRSGVAAMASVVPSSEGPDGAGRFGFLRRARAHGQGERGDSGVAIDRSHGYVRLMSCHRAPQAPAPALRLAPGSPQSEKFTLIDAGDRDVVADLVAPVEGDVGDGRDRRARRRRRSVPSAATRPWPARGR